MSMLPLLINMLFLSAEFSQAQTLSWLCRRRGGVCYFRRCLPYNLRPISRCSNEDVCCRRW
uniref:Beta-defensin-like domain-containing protein n=1 Tax=Chelydra serpentina TaxID=8475 RepID=A0A8C3TA67_CHESE